MLGTAPRRQDTHPPQTAEALSNLVLPDSDSHDVRLGDLWLQRPAALVWLRHYG